MTLTFKNTVTLLIFALFFTFFTKAQAMNYPNSITPQEAQTMVNAGTAVLIDVREQSEVALGIAAPAHWYPKSNIDANMPGFIEFLSQFQNQKIILYCRSGHRASLVIEQLNQNHIEAFNMGGFSAWSDAGLPTKKP